MAEISKLNITELDFDTIKNNLKIILNHKQNFQIMILKVLQYP